MWIRAELKARAKATLKTSYWKAFLISIIVAIAGGSSDVSGFQFNSSSSNSSSFPGYSNISIVSILVITFIFLAFVLLILAFRVFVGYALEVGGMRYFVRAAHGEPDMNHIGSMFSNGCYLKVVKSMLWRLLFLFLWTLLFIIPGFVKSYAYSMVPYILTDNPNIGYKRALELSNQMTKGHKFDMWVLDLSFLGWKILGALALLIGLLFLMPYQQQTKAELYIALRENALKTGLCTHDELFGNP